jgi:hypothetical protein
MACSMTVLSPTAVCLLLLSLSSCAMRTMKDPDEFSMSAAQIRRIFPASRSLGTATLHGRTIHSSQDKKGRPYHLAVGGALLVKKSAPRIIAKAPSILLTADHAQLRGRSVVKKQGRFYLGDSDRSTLIIDDVNISTKGPSSERLLASAAPRPAPPQTKSAPTPAAVQDKPAKPKPGATKPAATPIAQATQQPPAPTPKPQSAVPIAKPSPAKTQPSPPKPAAAPTPVDRAKLLKMMREPGEN